MFTCRNCGNPYIEGTKFCGICGASLETNAVPTQGPERGEMKSGLPSEPPVYNGNILPSDSNRKLEHQPRQHKYRRLKYIMTSVISVALTLVILAVTGFIDLKQAAPAGSIREVSFKEPEEAIEYYVEHFKSGDLNGMLAACDINEKAANFDFDKYFDRMKVWMYNTLLPSEYDTYVDINRYISANTLANAIKNQYIALTASDNEAVKNLLEGLSVTELGDFEIELIDPEAVRELKLVRMDLTYPELQKKNKKSILKAVEAYGGDDFKDYAVLYELDDQYYMAGFMLYHYDSGWKITAYQSSFAGINTIYPTTMSEYKATIGD